MIFCLLNQHAAPPPCSVHACVKWSYKYNTLAQHCNCNTLHKALELAGGTFGGLLPWLSSDGLGRQTSLTAGGIPALCGWLMISYTPQITGSRAAFLTVLFTGRFLTDIGSPLWHLLEHLAPIHMFIFFLAEFFKDFLLLLHRSHDVASYFSIRLLLTDILDSCL